jgi:hypothetical protein
MPMKLYEVELKRVSFVTYVVEALDENHAEDEAWKLLERDGEADNRDADWEVNNTWEYEA